MTPTYLSRLVDLFVRRLRAGAVGKVLRYDLVKDATTELNLAQKIVDWSSSSPSRP